MDFRSVKSWCRNLVRGEQESPDFARLQQELPSLVHGGQNSGELWVSKHPGDKWHDFGPVDLSAEEEGIVNRFHDLFYSRIDPSNGLRSYFVSWLGYEMFKCPLDLWIYQEIITRMRPSVIIETGTYKGGSALFLSSICDLLGKGEVITIDIDQTFDRFRPRHPRIKYLSGSSTDPEIFAQVEEFVAGRPDVLVILDSDHVRDHVLAELRLYRKFIPSGGYLIVEDTNINGHPTYPEFGPGPWEAVDQFLAEDKKFSVDRGRERFLLTMNPRGFLRRVKS